MAKRKHKVTKKMVAPRNPYAFDQIMRKGGVHEKTTKAKRKNAKQDMKRELKQLPFDVHGAINLIFMLTITPLLSKIRVYE